MSYTELKAFNESGDAVGIKKFRNSHYIVAIWSELAVRYGICPNEGRYSVIYDDAVTAKLWALSDSDQITDDDWYVLVSTYDNVVIPPNLIERVARAYENFRVPDGCIDHGKGFAEAMREILKTGAGLRGVAFWQTSVTSDPWYVREGCEECGTLEFRPYNLDVDEGHWYMEAREEV
jgi:hypothetical protein